MQAFQEDWYTLSPSLVSLRDGTPLRSSIISEEGQGLQRRLRGQTPVAGSVAGPTSTPLRSLMTFTRQSTETSLGGRDGQRPGSALSQVMSTPRRTTLFSVEGSPSVIAGSPTPGGSGHTPRGVARIAAFTNAQIDQILAANGVLHPLQELPPAVEIPTLPLPPAPWPSVRPLPRGGLVFDDTESQTSMSTFGTSYSQAVTTATESDSIHQGSDITDLARAEQLGLNHVHEQAMSFIRRVVELDADLDADFLAMGATIRQAMQVEAEMDETIQQLSRLSDEEITALPKIRFEREEQSMCAICLEPYQEGEILTALPCKHHFHVECAAGWMRRARHCPLCRQDILDAAETGDADEN